MALSKELYEERKAKGLCIQCSKEAKNGKVRCEECVENNRVGRAERSKQRKAAGNCTECNEPVIPGHALCAKCSQARAKVSTERYYRNKEAGVCRLCGADASGASRCPTCNEKFNNWRKQAGH